MPRSQKQSKKQTLLWWTLLLLLPTALVQCYFAVDSLFASNDLPPSSFSRSHTASGSSGGMCSPSLGLRPIKKREEIGDILQEHNFTSGVEVGVKQGEFAAIILDKWKSCTSYKLVDLWAQQTNYKDVANVNNAKHEQFMNETQERLKAYSSITEFMRMYSTEAAKLIPKESLDFAYIDARHDYCGVLEDMNAYYPLIRQGGILAGHDYNSNDEVRGQDWSLCGDGRRFPEAVKGAVLEFAMSKGLTVTVTYQERNFFTWMVQKPLC